MKHLNRYITIFFLLVLLLTFACSDDKKPSDKVISDGNSIHYEIHGSGDQTILFIHGWSNTLHCWDKQVSSFSQNYKVVTVDLPGFGKSINNRNLWTMDSFGSDIAAVIKHLDLNQVILVGFSMGGPVSIETAKQVLQKVRGIVLVDILQSPETSYTDEYTNSIINAYMDAVNAPTIEKVRPFFKTKQDELAERFIRMVKDVPKTGWKESLYNCMVWLNNSPGDSIKTLSCPVLAINSDQHPTDVAAFQKYSPMFKARIINGVNHVVFWEEPEQFNQLLEESIKDILSE